MQPNIWDYVPQDRQCTYNVTMGRFCVTVVTVDKQKVLFGVCLNSCLCYAACKIGSLYATLNCRLWAVWLYSSFPHYFMKDATFWKMLLHIKCMF
jgi:hypothetical protein